VVDWFTLNDFAAAPMLPSRAIARK
jgi:hypothetical protein